MITEEQIPQECIKALQKTMLSEGATFASMAVAMLNAWPGADTIGAVGLMKPSLILPLQETPNAE
jgi:hypothetical protein